MRRGGAKSCNGPLQEQRVWRGQGMGLKKENRGALV